MSERKGKRKHRCEVLLDDGELKMLIYLASKSGLSHADQIRQLIRAEYDFEQRTVGAT